MPQTFGVLRLDGALQIAGFAAFQNLTQLSRSLRSKTLISGNRGRTDGLRACRAQPTAQEVSRRALVGHPRDPLETRRFEANRLDCVSRQRSSIGRAPVL